MRYTLMHRDIEVADLGIDKDGITEIVSALGPRIDRIRRLA